LAKEERQNSPKEQGLWEKPLEAKGIGQEAVMKLQTRVFEFCNGKYTNLSELAQAMGISVSQIYRVRQGTRPINEKFIIGSIKAFLGHKLDDLFITAPDGSHNECR